MLDFVGLIVKIAAVVFGVLVLLWVVGFRVIRSDKVAVVEKWWSLKGSIKDAIISLHGEAGYQPNVLRGGIHFRSPLMYRVHVMPLVTISQGKIGYVFARDGVPLPPGQTLGKVIPGNTFEDVRAFMEAAASEVRSARFSEKAPTRSTWRSSSSSPRRRSTTCRWVRRRTRAPSR